MKRMLFISTLSLLVAASLNAQNEPYGHVLLNQGALTIQSNNGVTIKNDFEVKKGAVFEIK